MTTEPLGRLMVPFLDLGPSTDEVRGWVEAGWQALLDDSQFIGGAAVESFELAWAAYCGTAYAVGVANGTDALHLVLRALGVGPGDEVIVPANTFVATVEAILLCGARPRFADVDPVTLTITADQVRSAATDATKALIVVHLYGAMPDMDALASVAESLGIVVVEDAAQAHGATWHGRPAGSFGSAGCFSFYPGKNLGAFGDAGAVVTSDPRVAQQIRAMRDHGRTGGGHYEHGVFGVNSRLDAVQAVVLEAKLAHLDRWNAKRRRVAAMYTELLDPDLVVQVRAPAGCDPVYHLQVLRVPERDELRSSLAARGIATGVHYPTPCHLMAPYARYCDRVLPVSEAAAETVLSLPMYPHLQDDQVEYVARSVNELVVKGWTR